MSEPEEGYGLVLAFDTDEPEFARGCEAGVTYESLRRLPDDESETFVVGGNNAEMMLRIAEATGRPVRSKEITDDWLEVTFGPVARGERLGGES